MIRLPWPSNFLSHQEGKKLRQLSTLIICDTSLQEKSPFSPQRSTTPFRSYFISAIRASTISPFVSPWNSGLGLYRRFSTIFAMHTDPMVSTSSVNRTTINVLGRLACEYIVDMFSRAEEERLSYPREGRCMQSTSMRMEEATDSTVPDIFENKIPASFMGSRAWTSDLVADALAIAKGLGKPSMWLTMTTNPRWPEIWSQLKPGQDINEIPIIVCRAFHPHLSALKTFCGQNSAACCMKLAWWNSKNGDFPTHILLSNSNTIHLCQP